MLINYCDIINLYVIDEVSLQRRFIFKYQLHSEFNYTTNRNKIKSISSFFLVIIKMVIIMNNILMIGNLSYNINLFLNSYPLENQTYNIIKKTKSIGNILNISIVLSNNDLNVYYFSSIGDDEEGKEIINYLHSNKINTDYVNIINNYKTSKQYIIRNNKNDSKTILTERLNNRYNLNRDINFIPNVIYTDNYQLNLIKNLKQKFNTSKIITTLNEITNTSLEICNLSDYIIIPIKYAQILSNVRLDIRNKKSIIDLYIKTKTLFSGKIIIYIENIGTIYEYNNMVNIIPKLGNKNLVNKNSFDIFISTFIYCINQDFSIDKSIKISTVSKFLSDNNKQNLNIKEVIDIYEKNN